MKKILKNIGIGLIILLPPNIASANIGLPMIFVTLPTMIFVLIPIILIEAGVLKKFLKVNYKKAFLSSSVANLASTLIGIPLSWGLLLGLEIITGGGSCKPGFETIGTSVITIITHAAWLCPWEDKFYWLVPLAFILCLFVAFIISVFFEFLILKRILKNFDKKEIKKIVWIANGITYTLLIIFSLVFLFANMNGAYDFL